MIKLVRLELFDGESAKMIFAVEPVASDLWTTKEVVIAIGSTVATLATFAGGPVVWFVKNLNCKHNKEKELLGKENAQLKILIANGCSTDKGAIETLQNQLREIQGKLIVAHKQLAQQKSKVIYRSDACGGAKVDRRTRWIVNRCSRFSRA